MTHVEVYRCPDKAGWIHVTAGEFCYTGPTDLKECYWRDLLDALSVEVIDTDDDDDDDDDSWGEPDDEDVYGLGREPEDEDE